MVKKCSMIATLMLASGLTVAQQWPFELWHEGKIVLENGDTLTGHVKYDIQQDIVQYSVRDHTGVAFSARKVMYFEIFDRSQRKYRRFFTLPYSATGNYKTPFFFELMEEGEITLLGREFLEYKTYSSPYYVGSYSRTVLSYKYFFLKEDGEIEEFSGNKNDLLDKMGSKSREVEKYIRKNRLKLDDNQDLIEIVAYYNSLSGT